MKIKLTVNGKEVELTADQIKVLGLEAKDDPFELKHCDIYYYANVYGELDECEYDEELKESASKVLNSANYCKSKPLMQQRAYHEMLSRLLWRFAVQNDEPMDLEDDCQCKYMILYCYERNIFIPSVSVQKFKTQGVQYFSSENLAQRAIEEIVTPFLEQHPDFVW